MSRRSPSPAVFIIICIILIFDTNTCAKSQPFYENANDIMSMSFAGHKAAMRGNPIENCFQPDDFCNHGPKGCCSGSSCRCNLWGYNCRCQFDEDLPLSYEDAKAAAAYDSGSMRDDPLDKRSSNIKVYRRSCIRRGGACDHRPNDCCFSSSCRCNLWGSNCRCQRVGLFQKWG